MGQNEETRGLGENENRCPVCSEIVKHPSPLGEYINPTWGCPTCSTPLRLCIPVDHKTHNGFVLAVNVKEYRKRQGLPAEWE